VFTGIVATVSSAAACALCTRNAASDYSRSAAARAMSDFCSSLKRVVIALPLFQATWMETGRRLLVVGMGG
jgi:hypothetical protein